MTDSPDALMTGCDWCGCAVPVFDTLSVAWSCEEFCQGDCRDKWVNMRQGVGRP